MFAFGHVGLTWAGTVLLVEASRRLPWSRERAIGGVASEWLDYRLLIVGSMLPDLIDKPLGVFILRKQLSNGRTVAHTVLFSSLVALAALAGRRRTRRALGSAAIGLAGHLLLDRMWKQTNTLLWPLRGLSFERQDVSDWLDQMLEQLFSDPHTYLSEAVGAGVVVALLASLVKSGGLGEFIRSGRMRAGRLVEPPLAGEERPHQLERRERPA